MKKQQSFFSLVFAIYLIAGIAAIVLFYQQGSHLSHTLDQPDPVAQEADPQVPQTAPDVEVVEIIEPADSEVVEDNDTTDSEVIEDSDTTDSEVIEDNAATETDIVETNEEPQVISDAAIATDEVLPDDNEAKTYYGYTVNSNVHALRVRKTSERNAKIIDFVTGGDTGFVIEKGELRSRIITPDGTIGYVFNEYITISEIPKKKVPKEYR